MEKMIFFYIKKFIFKLKTPHFQTNSYGTVKTAQNQIFIKFIRILLMFVVTAFKSSFFLRLCVFT